MNVVQVCITGKNLPCSVIVIVIGSSSSAPSINRISPAIVRTVYRDVGIANPTEMAAALTSHVITAPVLFDRAFASWTALNQFSLRVVGIISLLCSFEKPSSAFSCHITRPIMGFFTTEKAKLCLAAPFPAAYCCVALAPSLACKEHVCLDCDSVTASTWAPPQRSTIGPNECVQTMLFESWDESRGNLSDVRFCNQVITRRSGAPK